MIIKDDDSPHDSDNMETDDEPENELREIHIVEDEIPSDEGRDQQKSPYEMV